jgi:uncharacterized protein YjiS (DUF1127 family)
MRFEIRGEDLNGIKRRLRKGLPGKRAALATFVTIDVTRTKAVFSLTGVAAKTGAKASKSFRAQVPYELFQSIWACPFPPDQFIKLEVKNGLFAVDGIKFESTFVEVALPTERAKSLDSEPPAIPPSADCLHTPLVSAYHYLRTYGLERQLGTPEFLSLQREVNALLRHVADLLQPLGVTRGDLEALLDKKIGKTPD